MDQGLCQKCNTHVLIQRGDQKFCQSCQVYTSPQDLQPQMRFVPQGYRPNTEGKQLSRDVRVTTLMGNLIDRYKVCSRSQLKLLIGEFGKYRSSRRKCRSYQAASAAVFYFQHRSQLLKTMKDFAEQNNIDRHEFNRCFIKYSHLKNNEASLTTDESFEAEPPETILEECSDFIKVISKDLFENFARKPILEEIAKAVLNKVERLLEAEITTNIPVLIFRGLKDLNFKVSAASFAKICKKYGKPTSASTLLKAQKDVSVDSSKQGTFDKTASSEQ